ncbi:hypothetical protein AMECASPLE_000073 [Ameca splendens]|uniref:Uncharacterized protein n=1 Tax=Ameca splendens TaxID=208324 RepID=A0ABV0Z7E9_9TELE
MRCSGRGGGWAVFSSGPPPRPLAARAVRHGHQLNVIGCGRRIPQSATSSADFLLLDNFTRLSWSVGSGGKKEGVSETSDLHRSPAPSSCSIGGS